ncbi:MAG: IS1380 family transposase [Acidobacteriota bacterium]
MDRARFQEVSPAMTECYPAQLQFPSLVGKPVVVKFTAPEASSDSGWLLLRQVDARLGVTRRLARCLHDERDPRKVRHEMETLLLQRVLQIAAGYEDCNDADRLRFDPILKLCCGRRPGEADLASQPTLSRWENSVGWGELRAMRNALMRVFLSQQTRPPAQVVIDLDSTDDEVHGHQQLRLFNGYYDEYCYLPLIVTAQADGGAFWPLFAWLRPALHGDRFQAATLLLGVIRKLRKAWPKTRLIVRADSGFASPELYRLCEDERVEYVFGLARNPRLEREIEEQLAAAHELHCPQSGLPTQVFTEFHYHAEPWRRVRRVVGKAEVTAEGDNVRFVVHTLREGTPREVYQFYAQRGEMENRIKELKLAIKVDRTSCHRFLANAFRVILHVAAYLLWVAMRELLAGTELAQAQVFTLRERLLKVAGFVTESVRRVLIRCPQAYPWPKLWFQILDRLA